MQIRTKEFRALVPEKPCQTVVAWDQASRVVFAQKETKATHNRGWIGSKGIGKEQVITWH